MSGGPAKLKVCARSAEERRRGGDLLGVSGAVDARVVGSCWIYAGARGVPVASGCVSGEQGPQAWLADAAVLPDAAAE